jgi:putative flippase GtrA
MIVYISDVVGRRFGWKPKEAERFLKFAVVGTIGFIVDFGTLTFLIEAFGLPTLLANTFSFSAAVASNFLWNRFWTYPDSRSKNLMAQLGQFALVNIMGLGINSLILWLMEPVFNYTLESTHLTILVGRGYIPAKMVATVTVLFWNFFINRYWTYNDVDG